MKQYVVDELRSQDFEKIKEHLGKTFGNDGIEGVYWVPLSPGLLTDVQAKHTECHPLSFALVLESHQLTCELLVRTRSRIRCACIGYATERQRNWVVGFIDAMCEELDIRT